MTPLLISSTRRSIISSKSFLKLLNKSSQPQGTIIDMDTNKWYLFNKLSLERNNIIINDDNNNKNIRETYFFDTESFSEYHKDNKDDKKYIEDGINICPKCNHRKIVSVQIQKRSADEGMSTILTCYNCKYSWEE